MVVRPPEVWGSVGTTGNDCADRDGCHRQQRRRAVAVDGKTLRGARDAQGRQVHLLAAMDHTTRAMLAQRQVDGAPGEVPALQPLLADLDLDLAGVVVTADALPAHADTAEFLITHKQAHYLFTVKANQPTLLDRCTLAEGISMRSLPLDCSTNTIDMIAASTALCWKWVDGTSLAM